MDRAYNNKTDMTISAFEVYKNGSYQNLTKGEWFAPKDSIYNYEEIEDEDKFVHYVSEKEYLNHKGTLVWCSPHFAVYPNSKAKTVEESPTHKLLKNWLFGRLVSDDINILFARGVKPHKYENKYKLSELDINWNDFEIEVTTKGTKKLRADILLPFKTRHHLLGEGIIFEIQLSSQNQTLTHERTIERALHGYSCCWLFEKDFVIEEDNIELKNNTLVVNSFSEQMHFAKKGFVKKLKYVVEEQCRFLDEKLSETNIQLKYLEDKKNDIIAEIKNAGKQASQNSLSKLNTREALLIKKIEAIEGNPFKGLVESYKTQLDTKHNESIKEINSRVLNMINVANKKMEQIDETYPRAIPCPKCKNPMIFKITSTQKKELYDCSHCNHIIWVR